MKQVIVPTNAPTQVGPARVVASNIWDEDYAADDGGSVHGLTAHVWVIEGDPPRRTGRRVHPGMELELGAARARVVSITREGVVLEVAGPPAGGAR